MIEQKRDEIQEVVYGLERVSKHLNEDASAPLKKAIELLSKAVTVSVGGKEITYISREAVDFRVYDLPSSISVIDGKDKSNEEKYVDTNTVAEYFGVTSETVRNWIKDKIISGKQVGGARGKYLIPREEFEFLKSKREDGRKATEAVMKDFLGDDYSEDWEIELGD